MDNPKLSVIIPNFGRLDNLTRCVKAVREYTEYPSYELLIIDDGTNNSAINQFISENADRFRLRVDNRGGAATRAELVDMAEGYYIAGLDSDTVVTPGWATKLISALEDRWNDENAKVQIVAALLTCQMGYFLARENPMNGFGLIQVETVGAACTLFRKKLIKVIGNFDPELWNLWSDLDFCKRLASQADKFEKDPKIAIDPRTVAYHHGWTGEDGIMIEDPGKNTRGLPELNTPEYKKRTLHSMEIIYQRWGVKHSWLDDLKKDGDVKKGGT